MLRGRERIRHDKHATPLGFIRETGTCHHSCYKHATPPGLGKTFILLHTEIYLHGVIGRTSRRRTNQYALLEVLPLALISEKLYLCFIRPDSQYLTYFWRMSLFHRKNAKTQRKAHDGKRLFSAPLRLCGEKMLGTENPD